MDWHRSSSLVLLFALAGCDSGGDPPAVEVQAAPLTQAQVLALNVAAIGTGISFAGQRRTPGPDLLELTFKPVAALARLSRYADVVGGYRMQVASVSASGGDRRQLVVAHVHPPDPGAPPLALLTTLPAPDGADPDDSAVVCRTTEPVGGVTTTSTLEPCLKTTEVTVGRAGEAPFATVLTIPPEPVRAGITRFVTAVLPPTVADRSEGMLVSVLNQPPEPIRSSSPFVTVLNNPPEPIHPAGSRLVTVFLQPPEPVVPASPFVTVLTIPPEPVLPAGSTSFTVEGTNLRVVGTSVGGRMTLQVLDAAGNVLFDSEPRSLPQ